MTQEKPPAISIIIPAYNEGDRICNTLIETSRALQNADYEIVLVDDGSSDATLAKANRAAQENERIRVFALPVNRGKGAALVFGCRQARGELIAFLDADLELHPRLILQFWKQMYESGADAVIGSKQHPDSHLSYPLLRRMASLGYAWMNRWLFGLHLRDTQTGIKLFRAQVIRRVIDRLQIERYAFDLELMVAISRFGYTILEAPVVLEFKRPQGGRLRLSAVARMAADTLQIFYWSSFWKWLEPSRRMKAWMVLFLLGVVLGSFGLAHWLAVYVKIPASLSRLAYLATLRFMNTAARDWLLVIVGLALVFIAGIQLNKGILAAFARADRGYTVDRKSTTEIKPPDIPPPPEG